MSWATWRDYRHFADLKMGVETGGDEYDEFGGGFGGP